MKEKWEREGGGRSAGSLWETTYELSLRSTSIRFPEEWNSERIRSCSSKSALCLASFIPQNASFTFESFHSRFLQHFKTHKLTPVILVTCANLNDKEWWNIKKEGNKRIWYSKFNSIRNSSKKDFLLLPSNKPVQSPLFLLFSSQVHFHRPFISFIHWFILPYEGERIAPYIAIYKWVWNRELSDNR